MCGRFTLSLDLTEVEKYLSDEYQIYNPELNIKLPRFNVAPGQQLLSIISDGTGYRAGTLKWGFVPFFASDEKIGYKMINAKSETIADKPSFKQSFYNKRCIILADGFYEWKKEGKDKTPYRMVLKDRNIFGFAGLWSSFTKEDGSKLFTCTIITTAPNTLMVDIHDRMPVILSKEDERIWLDPKVKDKEVLQSLLKPYNDDLMEAYPVSSLVNSVKNDVSSCIDPLIL